MMHDLFELKKCPFCGENGVLFRDIRYVNLPSIEYEVYGAKCSNRDCIMNQTQKFYFNEEQAIAAWNKRTKKKEDDIYDGKH